MRLATARKGAFGILLTLILASCGGGDGTGPQVTPPPGAPTNVQVVTVGDQSVTISWSPVADATSYNVYLASQAGVTKSNYSTRADGEKRTNQTSPAVINGLSKAQAYYFVVAAVGEGGESSESAEVSATPQVALNPGANVQLAGGNYTYTSLNIGAGVTVTVTGPVVITISGDATINGTFTGDCQSIEFRIDGDFTLDGLLTNICTNVPADPPGLKVVADGDLTVGSEVSNVDAIVSDGSIILTDSATENLDFTPIFDSEASPLAGSPAAAPAGQAGGGGNANLNRPVSAGRGRSQRTSRDGNINVNVNQTAGNGMDAAPKVDDPVCDNSLARGGMGGTMSYAARNGTLTIGAGVTLKAGDGGRGGDCTAIADPGSAATATAGPGGLGGSVLVGGQTVVFGAGSKLSRGNGGLGGDALAIGGDGVNPCDDGLPGTATGGVGGKAGGIGYVILEPGSIQGAPTEEGANGGKGGMATAFGGDGQDCTCEMGDGSGGDGGMATATGGKGGDGARGKIWTIGANSLKKGDGGDADATGGDGGDGGDCCDTKHPGGDGGKGGDAMATGGAIGDVGIGGNGTRGAASGSGGDGGDGGDGLPGGNGGDGGVGTGDPQDIDDGLGGDGGDLCAELTIWHIYFSTIPDGTIPGGTDMQLNTYDETQTQHTGEVDAHFDTPGEAGTTDVQYFKSGNFFGMGRGRVRINMSGLLPGFPVALVAWQLDVFCQIAGCVQLIGYYQGEEVGRMDSYPWSGPSSMGCQSGSLLDFCRQILQLPPPDGAPYYDAIAFFVPESVFGFWMDHWDLIIVDP